MHGLLAGWLGIAELLGHLYGGMDQPELKIIDVFVCHLRKKLAQATGGKLYIETVWGRGYRLCDPAEMSPTSPLTAQIPVAGWPTMARNINFSTRIIKRGSATTPHIITEASSPGFPS
jgi:DNA-binding winged helix-turn-helix (wHTH) protein